MEAPPERNRDLQAERPACAWHADRPWSEALLRIYIDGASRGNPGPAGIGVVMESEDGSLIWEDYCYIGKATNNVAEYRALLFALEKVIELGYARVQIYTDSELLVKQLNGEYRVKSPRIRTLFKRVLELRQTIDGLRIQHMDRKRNRRADFLANRAIDEALKG